ncbi:aryl-alcohol dehydrogenase-like predicted oxidoreductase [Actinokineospora auranticolor]|uniref:Aryl-alcohol dehydrogenase-like predicted oxidoreductase n=1 Tax=Actinokineospora auranticolor TaxID=155976 RepID=A0A2S6GSQ1_9PSEU|nr:aryl-alcohol dehydrogenase-like predicted oxidoreductase [Actinokineospora auranticolor]
MVSAVGLGCNNLGRPGTAAESLAGSRDLVGSALDAGVSMFDVADVYGAPRGRSEELLGQALAGRRDRAVIATKFGLDMQGSNGPDFGARGSRRYLRLAAEASLRRLGTDWIDLYQLHRPDPGTPLVETLSALDDLVRDGLVRYAGVCNLAAWQIADVAWTTRTEKVEPMVSVQAHYSLLDREVEREVLPAAARFSMSVLPYFPLANGLLTGKYARAAAPPEGSRLAGRQRMLADAPWDRIEKLRALADERGISMTTLAIGWLAAQPAVGSVIAGATTADQIRENAKAAAWRPTAEDLVAIDEICPPRRR